ncbi:MAG: glycosyltransferase [Candidatus Electrothrix sp. AW5]|nr:glycosyltransferase [Candidatus Electrothrix gigas]
MKILHIVSGELNGGAARGAYWLHLGLKQLGVDSKVLTNSFDTLGDNDVVSIADSTAAKVKVKINSHLDSFPTKLYRNRKRIIFSTGFVGRNFLKSDIFKWADIIHLHWINAGFIDIKYLSRINKPIVWTMRDMWPMTGGCHVAEALHCDKYKTGCGGCPQLGSHYSFDLSKIVIDRKKKYLPKTTKLVGISPWLSECAQQSKLFHDFDIQTISNNIDCSQFFPVEKAIARNILGIRQDVKVVLAGATSLDLFYKGFDKLLAALNFLSEGDIHLVFFGNLSKDALATINHSFTSLGYLHDTISLRIAYSAADVFVAPSLMDAFGKTLAEAMSCGTPTVCFDATGPRDIVDNKRNGFRAKPFDPKDLAYGIQWVLEDEERYKKLSENARMKVEKHFDLPVIARQYKELYASILEKK